jgi:hypothetical protein
MYTLGDTQHISLGKNWVGRFLKRAPTLVSSNGKRIEGARLNGCSKEALGTWFTAYKDLYRERKFEQHNIYNMDETGFSIGTMQSTRVVWDSSVSTTRTCYQRQLGRQEWVSSIECICQDGTALKPLIIFKGQHFLSNWTPSTREVPYLSGWHFTHNTKGWTSNVHGLEWLQRVFEPQTRAKAANGVLTRLLICDGHDSHISGNFVSYAI